jgi:hypothetical protein
MATLGHGLLGLSIAGLAPRRAGSMRWAFLFPGFMVLLAYVVDVTEWVSVIIDPERIDRRIVSHSVMAVIAVTLGGCAAVGFIFRARHPLPYVLAAAAVLSHVVLDLSTARRWLWIWYWSGSPSSPLPDFAQSMLAETCLYSLTMILALLARGALEAETSPRARVASVAVALLCCVAAWTRTVWFWAPAYALALPHAGIMLRRHLSGKWLWGLLFLTPLVPLVGTEVLVSYRSRIARELDREERYAEAIPVYQSALDLPSRRARATLYTRLGLCHRRLGDPANAEIALHRAMFHQLEPGFAELALTPIYFRTPESPFFNPAEAVRLCNRIIDAEHAHEDHKRQARRTIEKMRAKGLID